MFWMRSPLLVLLLVLLPLQLVWAAVGPHDSAPEYGVSLMTARHLCEHHQMGLAAADEKRARESARMGTAAIEVECGTCHAQGPEALPARRGVCAAVGQEHFGISIRARWSPVPASRPERPQWHALA